MGNRAGTIKEELAALKTTTLFFRRFFTTEGISPFDTVKWEKRDVEIVNENKEVIFKQEGVLFPSFYSFTAGVVVASKYFRGLPGTPERENSMKQLISRVVNTITRWGLKDGYFNEENARIFNDELTHLLLYQFASFNSPVWFNVGVEANPQCSACFINSIADTMESILELAKSEGMIFKYGSGTGTNLSPLRSSFEVLSGGGKPSGPVSFMKGFDAFAGVIKSGGKTRRAAKMVILNIDHPDIVEFIECKENEEKKAWTLIDAGYDGNFGGEAYNSVFFQNSNNAVRVPDAFIQAVISDGAWHTIGVTTKKVIHTYKARDLLYKIAKSTYVCGDPGMQFDTTINDWNTCSVSGRINASNPCSEFMFLDDSACNLSSLNLMKFLDADGNFDCEAFKQAVRVMITAQEIIVDNASYPTNAITTNSKLFRPLGLGYANLGALLMRKGHPYDSDAGRDYAAAVTALMTGEAYLVSSDIAAIKGAFSEYEKNRDAMLGVIRKHISHLKGIDQSNVPVNLYSEADAVWRKALTSGEKYGFRNAQVTLLAPTGTIGFMMDCDTTGIEPEMALVKYKKLVGGGSLKIVNQTVPSALEALGYSKHEISKIIDYMMKDGTIEGSEIRDEHLPVFDCAYKSRENGRVISTSGHLRMMAAVQPFLSGAISKTVTVPNETTIEEIMETYMEAWRLKLKAIAIYRDGCKRIQPLSTTKEEKKRAVVPLVEYRPVRRKLPDERKSLTHKFSIGGHEGYITVGMYDDGSPGEIFIVMAKQGSVISGLMDSFATAISLALQYGVQLKVLVDKFSHVRFEPSGFSTNPDIGYAKSIVDYIFRWLALKFLPEEARGDNGYVKNLAEDEENGAKNSQHKTTGSELKQEQNERFFIAQQDAPPCQQCGSIMVRNGTCYKCLNCGATSGCS